MLITEPPLDIHSVEGRQLGKCIMQKCNLFNEIMTGLEALQAEREGKVTLKRVKLTTLEIPRITPDEILTLRESRNLSRAVFANVIRTNPRTLENWEQGRSKPNPHAILLMKLVDKFPETLQHLRAI